MANKLDERIHEIIQDYVIEAEKGNFSRNMEEQRRRIDEEVAKHAKIDVLASGHFDGQHDQGRLFILREAVLELAEKIKDNRITAKPVLRVVENTPEPEAEPVTEAPKKRGRKPKGAA